MRLDKYAQGVLRERFAGRQDLGHKGFFEVHYRDLGFPESEVISFLGFVEFEVGIPGGVLRPSDSTDAILDPPRTRNPFAWLEYQVKAGDIRVELEAQIDRRLKEANLADRWPKVSTIDDVIRIWCGRRPGAPN